MLQKDRIIKSGICVGLTAALLLGAIPSRGAHTYAGTGLVLKVNAVRKKLVVSMQEIPGYMEAMVMPLEVRQARELQGLRPGVMVEFTLVVSQKSSYAENIRVRPFESLENDPLNAGRLTLLEQTLAKSSTSEAMVEIGQRVPDFTLIDQNRRRVALAEFAGKVVVVDFVYTRCPLPNFCFRLSSNFAQIQKRFAHQMGHDLILLTVTLDAVHDHPEELTQYASIWKANPEAWHFLTGSGPEVKKVTGMFGVGYWPDEGTMIHSLHTAVINRQGELVANLEGNTFTAKQLGDLVETVLNRGRDSSEIRSLDVPPRSLANTRRAQE